MTSHAFGQPNVQNPDRHETEMWRICFSHQFFFLEHTGELRINILRRKKGEAPTHQSQVLRLRLSSISSVIRLHQSVHRYKIKLKWSTKNTA
jgi:hypothetical protein